MEWLQDQLLRLAARYYCQDMDIDASKLQIEKWDSESCKIRATDLRLTNEHGSLSVAECFLDVTQGVAIEDARHYLNSGALEIHRRFVGERLAGPGRQPAGGHPRGALPAAPSLDEERSIRNNKHDGFNNQLGRRRGVVPQRPRGRGAGRLRDTTNAKPSAERRCDATTRKLAKAEVEVVGGDTGLIVDAPFYALVEEAAPYLKRWARRACFARSSVRDLWYESWASMCWERRGSTRSSSTTTSGRGGAATCRPRPCGGGDRRTRRRDDSNLLADAGGTGPGVRAREFVSERRDGYDDACARSPREPPGWRHPNFVKKPVLDGGRLCGLTSRSMGPCLMLGCVTPSSAGGGAGPATKAPSYTCTLG